MWNKAGPDSKIHVMLSTSSNSTLLKYFNLSKDFYIFDFHIEFMKFRYFYVGTEFVYFDHLCSAVIKGICISMETCKPAVNANK